MVKTDDTNDNKKKMIEALEKTLGIVTHAANMVGIHRDCHYRWMKEDSEYKAAVESVGEGVLDFAESKLHGLIDSGDTAATIFYMKTKGKKRGYIERQELTGPDNQPVITISANL